MNGKFRITQLENAINIAPTFSLLRIFSNATLLLISSGGMVDVVDVVEAAPRAFLSRGCERDS